MPLINGSHVALSRHAWERIHEREIPHHVVREAVEHPFRTVELPDGREMCSVPAPVRGRWAWVQVVLKRLDTRRVEIITAYPQTRTASRAAAA